PIEWPPLAFGKTSRVVSDLEQVHTEIEVGLGVVWLQLDGPLIVMNCVTGLAEPAGDISEAVMRLGIFVFHVDHLREASAGVLVVLGIPESNPQIILGPGKTRLKDETLAIGSDGFVELSLLVKFVAPLEMKGRRPQDLLLAG